MNNFDEWSLIISRFLKAEADLLTSVTKHEIAADSTREAFIRGVLEPFLPSSYAIGSGRIIDSSGQSSDPVDIVIYRRDFPRLNLPGSSDVFLYESVLATIEVRTKLIRKTLFDTLNCCASIAKLNPGINAKILQNVATKNNLKLNQNKKYIHKQPILTDRFNLIGRPPGFIYGFSGFQTSPGQLNDNVKIWYEQRQENGLEVDLNSFPAVVATQGCIGWRNAAPLSAKSSHLFGIGVDAAPIRLIVFQLLYLLNNRLKVTADSMGIKPNVDAYLKQMAAPEIQYTVGKATNSSESAAIAEKTASETKKVSEPKKTKSYAASSRPVVASKPVPEAKPVIEPTPTPKPEETPKAKPAFDSKPVFETKPDSNFTAEPEPESAPKPEVAQEPEAGAIPKPGLGAMFHPDPTLWEMPVPDGAMVPEHEPEPDPFIETMPTSALETKPEPVVTEKASVPEPEPEPEPFIETMRISPSTPKPASQPVTPDAKPESDSEDDPFLQTVRIPAPDSVSKSDPFSKTIPGLQDPPKSVH